MLARCRIAWAQLTEKLGRSGVAASRVRTGSLRTQSARHKVDHGTICGRSCANSGHYKPLCACVDRTFVNPNSSRQRPEKIRARHGRERIRSSTSNLTRLPNLGGRPQSSPGCTIPMVKFSSACGCHYFSSGGRRRRQSEKSTRGSRSVFCSAMADVSMQMPTR
jgi:hypothetical protein